MTAPARAPSTRIQRVVVHAGSDARAAQRLAAGLPDALRGELAAGHVATARDAERAIAAAARQARR
jgi:hypothetical protein